MSDEKIFRNFIEWLNRTWYKVPDADELLPLLKARYTRSEAGLLTGMPFSGRSLAQLAEIKQMEPAKLKRKLDSLAKKGIVFCREKNGETHYSLNDAFFVFLRSTFWTGKTDKASKAIAPHVNQYYYYGFFDQYAKVHHKGLRTVPIDETVEHKHTHKILPYEDVVKIVDQREYWAVSHCPCRHRKNIDPDSPNCKMPTENCLHFDGLGRYTVENGMGREITPEETHEILRNAAEKGLVHGASNWREGVDTICNCCKCCCMWMEAYHKLGHSKSLDPSNYRLRTNPEECIGCGLCVRRCPMEALHLEESGLANNKFGKVSVLTPQRCIGCGVCAYKCPSKALVLERRTETTEPPRDAREYVRLFMEDCQKNVAPPKRQDTSTRKSAARESRASAKVTAPKKGAASAGNGAKPSQGRRT